MNLRNFLYVNPILLDDYISAIDGYIYEEETLKNNNTKTVEGGVEGGIPIVKGKGLYSDTNTQETQKQVKITNSAKFDKIYKYLKENDSLRYYEQLDEELWNNIFRDNFLEVLVIPRFSKLKEMANLSKSIGKLAETFQPLTDKTLIDKKGKEALEGFSSLGDSKIGNEITCIFNFRDKNFPMIAYLDEQNFNVSQERFVGEVYMLCKIQRKLEKGDKIDIDEIFDSIQRFPMNRKQQRAMKKDASNPKIIKDQIKGPAFVVTPVAIYQ